VEEKWRGEEIKRDGGRTMRVRPHFYQQFLYSIRIVVSFLHFINNLNYIMVV